MKPKKLILLESLRGFAALYVVFHHLTLHKKNIFSYIFAEGQAAVMLFFVLSGFVIYYSTHRSKEEGRFYFNEYFFKRFRRIYPIFLAALAIAYLTRCWGKHTWLPIGDDGNLIGNLVNLQDFRLPGNWFRTYYYNGPLWSLSYEWWFYLLFFPIFKWVQPHKQKLVVLAISIAGFFTFYFFPNKISITLEYFVIWWSGVELARSYVHAGKITRQTQIYLLYSFGIMELLLCAQAYLYKIYVGKPDIQLHPIIELRHFTYAVIIIAFGIVWFKYKFWGSKYVLRPFLLFAPISYSLYVFNYPFVNKNNLFGFKSSLANHIVGFFAVIAISYLFEIILQKKINAISEKYLQKMKAKNSRLRVIEKAN